MPAYQLENGRWSASFYYRNVKGELKHKFKRSFDTEEDALEYEANFLENVGETKQLLVSELIDQYMADIKPRIRWSTYEYKDRIFKTKIMPYLGNKVAGEVTSLDIVHWQGWLDGLRQKNGRAYSATFIREVNSQMSALFNYAEKHYGLVPNPTKRVKKTGSSKSKEMLIWTKDEYTSFLSAVSNKNLSFYAFELLYWAGIREGELLALTPADFDLEEGTLTINKSYARRGKEDVIGPPKTKKSYRTIVLSDFLVDEIRQWFINEGYDDVSRKDERLFKVTKHYLFNEMVRGCELSGVKRIRVHDLRHSHVSMLIHMGFSAVAIGARMGHESEDITYRYAHLFPNVQDEMADSLQGIIERERKN